MEGYSKSVIVHGFHQTAIWSVRMEQFCNKRVSPAKILEKSTPAIEDTLRLPIS